MEKYDLSKMYYLATSRMVQECTDLYESLHDDSGEVVTDPEILHEKILSFRKTLSIEIDLMKQSLISYNEEKL